MTKEEPIELIGTVAQVLPGTMFRVALPNGHVRARIASIDSFSGHADKNELRHYL